MDTFRVGVAVRDITPEPGLPMWGYSGREGPATGVLDPLHAKAVVLKAEGEPVALVTLDLGRVPREPVCEEIRARARAAGVADVFLAATHTHHAPVVEMPESPFPRMVADAVVEAIEEAASTLQPARIGVGTTEIAIAHNRRKILDDGSCFMVWRNEERTPTGPVDPEATLIKIETDEGNPLASIVHFSCHPVIMGPSNLQYSGDYVGEMCRVVKERTGAECLFLQGACGDINPFLDKTPTQAGAVDCMRRVGGRFAKKVIKGLRSIESARPESPAVALSRNEVTVGTRWDYSDPEQRRVFIEVHGAIVELLDEDTIARGAGLAVPLTVLVLNREIAFAGFPGEVFVQYQTELKAKSPVKHSLLCGYVDGYHAYFPTVRDALAGGYGGTIMSYVGLGAADKLLLEAQLEIGQLSGKLRPNVTRQDFAVSG